MCAVMRQVGGLVGAVDTRIIVGGRIIARDRAGASDGECAR